MIPLILVCFMVLLSIGCTGTDETAKNQNDQYQTTKPIEFAENTYPVPPPDIQVEAQMEKDPIDQSITITFAGGTGQNLVQKAWVIVTRSDKTQSQVELKPNKMAEVTVPGTKETDHVIVFAQYYNGNIYTIGEGDLKTKDRMSRI